MPSLVFFSVLDFFLVKQGYSKRTAGCIRTEIRESPFRIEKNVLKQYESQGRCHNLLDGGYFPHFNIQEELEFI